MMKKGRRIRWCSVALLALSLAACQVKRPGTVLTDEKMEQVLYDFHIAKAMGEEVPYNESYKRVLYIESVYKKHGITQADFDTSMVWFARHPDALVPIYEKVNERLKAERGNVNHLIALRDNKPKESLPGDSIDVWIAQRIFRLTGMPLDNRLAFSIPSDTNFKERDTLRWTVHFRFPQGVPDTLHAPLMAMQVLYAKDTLNKWLNIRQEGAQTLELYADTLGAIKTVRGFIYYPLQQSERTLLAHDVELMRYHATDTLFAARKDSTAAVPPSPKKEPLNEVKPVEPLKQADEKKEAVRPGIRPRPQLHPQKREQ